MLSTFMCGEITIDKKSWHQILVPLGFQFQTQQLLQDPFDLIAIKMKYSHWVLWRAGSFLFHITVTSIFIYSFIYQELTREERYSRSSKSPNPEPEFGGDWKFLTRWDFVSYQISEIFRQNSNLHASREGIYNLI